MAQILWLQWLLKMLVVLVLVFAACGPFVICPSKAQRPALLQWSLIVRCTLKGIPGASVEHNTFCVSAHFRNCAADRWHEVVSAVEHAIEGNEQLRVTRGRKVLEVRPKVRCS
eukprot:910229-Pelagomonas_calceolata.AAC.3